MSLNPSPSAALRIKIGYELVFDCPQPTPMFLILNVHSSRVSDLEQPDHIHTDPVRAMDMYRDSFGNWCTRMVAPAGRIAIRADTVVRDSGLADALTPNAQQHPIEQLPHEALTFLLGSRYCETDRMMEMAWGRFASSPPGWARVQAICDFVHGHIEFGYQHARATKTALEAYTEGAGVCRDFTHLAVTLCRCLNIPARYCTGYLGDIGIPPVPDPMDFSAWFEVYLGGRWHTFDARHNTPRIGRILIARGRDAADVSISTAFGPNTLSSFQVWTDELPAAA